MLFMWLIYVILSTLAICGVMLSSARDTGGLFRSVLPQDTRKKDFNEVVRPIWRIPELAEPRPDERELDRMVARRPGYLWKTPIMGGCSSA